MKKFLICILAAISVFSLTACETSGSRQDIYTTQENANNIQENQPTPTDLDISFPDAWCHYECEVIGTVFDEEAPNET